MKNYVLMKLSENQDEEILEEIKITKDRVKSVEDKAKFYADMYKNEKILIFEEGDDGELQKINSFCVPHN